MAIPKNSNADEIVEAANKVLGDPGYLERITEMSDLMGLQRHSPLEDAVWVMEYVAKTKGAGNAQSGAATCSEGFAICFHRVTHACYYLLR